MDLDVPARYQEMVVQLTGRPTGPQLGREFGPGYVKRVLLGGGG